MHTFLSSQPYLITLLNMKSELMWYLKRFSYSEQTLRGKSIVHWKDCGTSLPFLKPSQIKHWCLPDSHCMYPIQLLYKVTRETASNMKAHPYITTLTHADTHKHRHRIVHTCSLRILFFKNELILKEKKSKNSHMILKIKRSEVMVY